MEELLECYFTNVFAAMTRDALLARHKRREVIDYFVRVVAGCTLAGVCDTPTGYRHAVAACLRHHAASKATNGAICLRGKHHSLLYVAAKLAYDGRVDGDLVAELLRDIFSCEGSFEKLIVGAIFGSKAASLMIGWTSDFDSREENVLALEFFLEHATRRKLAFPIENGSLRLVDFPMESYGLSTPLRSTVLLNKADVLRVLLRYGATMDVDEEGHVLPIDFIIDGLFESYRLRGPVVFYQETVDCIALLFRVVPSTKLKLGEWDGGAHDAKVKQGGWDDSCRDAKVKQGGWNDSCRDAKVKLNEGIGSAQIDRFLKAHPFIPVARCGGQPVALKHLCRVAVRSALNRNWQLPAGIYQLNVPSAMMDYLDLKED